MSTFSQYVDLAAENGRLTAINVMLIEALEAIADGQRPIKGRAREAVAKAKEIDGGPPEAKEPDDGG